MLPEAQYQWIRLYDFETVDEYKSKMVEVTWLVEIMRRKYKSVHALNMLMQ